jgi:large subunit ribosomal protein L19e
MKNLNKRKALASRVLGAGKNKIIFDVSRLEEVKEAITKQDIRDLFAEGIIRIAPARGRQIKEKRRTNRKAGKIKRKIKLRKVKYVILTRKLRKYIKDLKTAKKIDQHTYADLRKKIKSKIFKDLSHLKEHIGAEVQAKI